MPDDQQQETAACRFEPCTKDARTDGLCPGHYQQQWRGAPLTPLRRQIPKPVPEGQAWCSTHQQFLPLDHFGIEKSRGTPYRQCRRCRADAMAIYNERNRDSVRLKVLLGMWGITAEQYAAMFEAQDHRCAVCGAERRAARNLVIDHDHNTGVLRGLTCNDCNLGMGQFADDPALLEKAAAYLRSGGPMAGSGLRVPPGGRQERKAALRDAARARQREAEEAPDNPL